MGVKEHPFIEEKNTPLVREENTIVGLRLLILRR